MTKSNLVSLKTQTEVSKFHEWLQKLGNIYLSDNERMDRAYSIIKENVELTFKSPCKYRG
jgi:hypothetical protein